MEKHLLFPYLHQKLFRNTFQINHFFSIGGNFEKNGYKLAIGSKAVSCEKPETEVPCNSINYSNPNNPSIDFGSPNSHYLEGFFQVMFLFSNIILKPKKSRL